MAVPGAVARRAEREAADLRAAGIDPTSGAPIAVQTGDAPATLPQAPAATPAPTPNVEDPAALRARIAELEQVLSTQNGRTSTAAQEAEELKAQLKIISDNRTFLEGKLTELTQKVTDLESEKSALASRVTSEGVTAVAASLDETGPTEKQIEDFGKESIDFVERISKRLMATVMKPLLAQLSEMEKQLALVREINGKLPNLEKAASVSLLSDARNRERDFFTREVLAFYPDFEKIRDSDEWKKYLLENVPDRGYKIGELLKLHRDSSNAAGIRTVIGAFYDRQKLKPSLESLAVPGKTGGESPPKPEATKMKSSEYKRMLQQFTFKRVPKAEWEAYRARWEQALASGNVEMDEEIR